MAVLLGLFVALTYGTGDFFGGLAAKRTTAMTVVVGSFCVSALLLAGVTAVWAIAGGLPSPDGHDLILGAATGCIAPVALACLYHGLATGRMSVVAPITTLVAAVVPFGWGVVHGERPSGLALVGVALALVAVGLISGAPTAPGTDHTVAASTREVVPGAMVAGIGFGAIFVLLGSTSAHAGLWPLLAARLVAVVLVVGTLAALGRPSRPTPGSWRLIAAAGTFDITANAAYLAATNRGLLSIVAVLSSLYPASTVVLARVVLAERLHRVQLVGLVLGAVGVAAIATA